MAFVRWASSVASGSIFLHNWTMKVERVIWNGEKKADMFHSGIFFVWYVNCKFKNEKWNCIVKVSLRRIWNQKITQFHMKSLISLMRDLNRNDTAIQISWIIIIDVKYSIELSNAKCWLMQRVFSDLETYLDCCFGTFAHVLRSRDFVQHFSPLRKSLQKISLE